MKKITALLLMTLLMTMVFSCASRGKNKCNDCPRFSQVELQRQQNG